MLVLGKILISKIVIYTAWNVSVFGVILVRIFPYSVRMRENADQNNSEYGNLLRSAIYNIFLFLKYFRIS